LLHSQRKSLIRFLIIYSASTFLLFFLATWIFYNSAKYQIVQDQYRALKYESNRIVSELRVLHQSTDIPLVYPNHLSVQSAIYDADNQYIFGSFSKEQRLMNDREKSSLYYVTKVEPSYLGATHLLTSTKLDLIPIWSLRKHIFIFMIGAGILFLTLGYFLGRLFVAPMKESMEKMNYFIQDTTHELNTPISTILTNIEMIDTLKNSNNYDDELKRIEIASKVLSRIYDDLAYLNLNHDYYRDIITVNIAELLHERIEYFESMSKAKKLSVTLNIKQNTKLEIDKNDAVRLIDNLISNAIKYNKYAGEIKLTLNKDTLTVADTGIGIDDKELEYIAERFKRANKSEGGFGIGLHIVSQVCNNYGYELKINSKLNRGTEVVIQWEK